VRGGERGRQSCCSAGHSKSAKRGSTAGADVRRCPVADPLFAPREPLLVGLCQLREPLQIAGRGLLAVDRCAVCRIRRGAVRRGSFEPRAERVLGFDLCRDPCHVGVV
jgi:hypothetical protein